MTEPYFDEGAIFETPDGRVEITGVSRSNERIVYSIEYKELLGTPMSVLAEEELKNNSEISKV